MTGRQNQNEVSHRTLPRTDRSRRRNCTTAVEVACSIEPVEVLRSVSANPQRETTVHVSRQDPKACFGHPGQEARGFYDFGIDVRERAMYSGKARRAREGDGGAREGDGRGREGGGGLQSCP